MSHSPMTIGWPAVGTTRALSTPARVSRATTQSAARAISAPALGSAETEGMAMNSINSAMKRF